MNQIIALAFVALAASSAQAHSLADIAGSYRVTVPDFPIVNVVSISQDGTVTLQEQSPAGTLNCKGAAVLSQDVLSSEMKCENNKTFTQRINLGKVSKFDSFIAPVFSSLYGVEMPMNFTRVQ